MSAGTYLVRLRPFLESADEVSEALKRQLDDFNLYEFLRSLLSRLLNLDRSLLGLLSDMEAMRKRRWLRKILGKDHISTKLLDRERTLRDAYDSLMVCSKISGLHAWLMVQRRCGLHLTRTLPLGWTTRLMTIWTMYCLSSSLVNCCSI